MFWLGCLSLVQETFLPGFILCRTLDIKGLWRNLLFSFALSLIFNYVVVFLSASLGLYTRITVYLIFATELVLVLFLCRPFLERSIERLGFSEAMGSFFTAYLGDIKQTAKSETSRYMFYGLYVLAFMAAVLSLIVYLGMFIHEMGSIFTVWDAVVSWDRWAVDWFHNHLPQTTWHYPQLIPANWSLTYQFMGESRLKFFAKGSMWLFEFFILVIGFDLAVWKKRAEYFAGTSIIAILLWRLGSRGSGNVDSAVAFFGFLAIACLLYAREAADRRTMRVYALLGAFFASGAAITKQAGLFIAVVYAFLSWLILFRSLQVNDRTEIRRLVVSFALIYLFIIGSWYIYKEIDIRRGGDYSELSAVTNAAHFGRDYVERYAYGIEILKNSLGFLGIPGYVNLIVVLALLFAGLLDPLGRLAFGVIVVPYFLMWAFLFSYDTRNLAPIVPFAGIVAGLGLRHVTALTLKAQRLKVWHILVSLAIILLVASIQFTDSLLLSVAIEKQKTLGDANLNRMLYEVYQSKGFQGKILTDYQTLGFLPDLQGFYVIGYSNQDSFIGISSSPEIGYVLLNRGWANHQTMNYFEEKLADGVFEIDGQYEGWLLIDLKRSGK